VPRGQTHPQKNLPKGKVNAKSKNAHINVEIKALEEMIEERARRGSNLRKRSTGILEVKG